MLATRPLYYGTTGPHNAKIVVVAESWGEQEAAQQCALVGSSGKEFDRILAEAGIHRSSVLCTNLIAERPQNNETWRFFLPKNSNPNAKRVGGLIPSGVVESEMQRLYLQLADRPRDLVIAAGNYSLWGLSRCTGSETVRESNGRRVPEDLQTFGPTGIMNWRGSMLHVEPRVTHSYPMRLLPIIHPAAIMRQWALKTPTIHDLKTRVPMALRGDWRPKPPPLTLSPPTFGDIHATFEKWLERAKIEVFDLAVDIETLRHEFISCIGFADSSSFAISIPFISSQDSDGAFNSYWSPTQEAQIISYVQRLLSHPNIRIIGQNFIYDTQFIQHWFGVTPRLSFDTMLAQNVLFPGTPKDLGYLSSLYCQYHWYWKDDVKDWRRLGGLKELLEYNCVDVLRTWEIAQAQKLYIKSINQEAQVEFKMETSRLCLRMMNRGVLFDKRRASSMLFELQAALTAFHQELLAIIPQAWVMPHKTKKDAFWYKSAKQTAMLFYNILGMAAVANRKTGNRTVGKEALMVLERKYPEFTGLFRRLDYAGSTANTANVITTSVEADGRMRCSYNPGGTETHRLSSSENVFGRGTNLQNLSKGEEDD